jgi:hypothetical protein
MLFPFGEFNRWREREATQQFCSVTSKIRKGRWEAESPLSPVHAFCYNQVKMNDVLQEYRSLRAQLLAERESVQKRLTALNAVLETAETSLPSIEKLSKPTSENASTYTPRKGTLPAKILKTLEKGELAMQVKNIAAAVKGNRIAGK